MAPLAETIRIGYVTTFSRSLRAVLALAALCGCGGGDLVLPGGGQPATITVVRGDGQSGRVGTQLDQPLVARVTDTEGRPVADTRVVFELVDGGPEAALAPDSTRTGTDGQADAHLTLGSRVGRVTGRASVPTPDGQGPIAAAFSATALPQDANELRLLSGDGQSGPVGTALPDSLVVQVTDAFQNPIPNVTINWTAEGGGEVSAASVTTGDAGTASVSRTLGPTAGQQQTLASAEGLSGSPVVFTHNATAGGGARIVIVSGNGQSAQVGTALPESLVVQVLDSAGNAVPGAPLNWIIATGGGSVTPTTGTTHPAGNASARWSVGPDTGQNTLNAVASGIGIVTFIARGTPDPGTVAARLEPAGGDGQTGPVRTPLPQPLRVKVTSSTGAPVGNVPVTWATTGGGSVSAATTQTGSDGTTEVTRTLGDTPGQYGTTATAAGLSGSPVSFTSTATPGAGSVLALRTQPSATATAGRPFDRQPVVQLRDAVGNDVQQPNVAVTAAASGPGALGGTATRFTNDQGRAVFTDLSIGGATGSHTIIFTADGYTPVTSSAIDVQKASTTTRITDDRPDPSNVGQAVPIQFTVTSPAGSPSGDVTVGTGIPGESCTAPVAAGQCPITFGAAGERTLTATYAGDATFAGSSATESHIVNTPPTASPDVAGTAEDQSVLIPVLANDADPDPGTRLTPVEVSDPPHGSAVANGDGTVTYTPDPNFFGADGFTYRASDGVAASDPVTVSVTVTPVNDAPIAVADEYTAPGGTPFRVDPPGVLANDTDAEGDPLSVPPLSLTQTAHGVVVLIEGGGFLYFPAPGFAGDDSFTYQASDGQANSEPATVTIHVQ